MGSLLDQSVEEVFNSEVAQNFRESILDGSYRYCNVQECSYLSNDWLPDLTEEEIEEIRNNKIPRTFVLAYEETCNHACVSCRPGYFKGCDSYYEKVDKISEKLIPYLNEAQYIDCNGRGEIMISEHMLCALDKVDNSRDDFVFNVETNAALFDEAHFKRIEHLTKRNFAVTATVNSFHDSTYRFLNGYANHVDKVITNLEYMRELRSKEIINKLTLSIVVQESNFRELPEWVDRCLNEFKADAVRIRGIMKFSMDEDDFWMKDVFNPAHPFYKEAMDIIHQPIMQDERVWYWEGDYENVRKPVKNPARRFQDNYENLWNLIRSDCNAGLKKYLVDPTVKSVALYGAGHISEYLAEKITCLFPNIKLSIWDSYHGGYLGNYPIVDLSSPDVPIPDVDLVINTITYYEDDVTDKLKEKGFTGKRISVKELYE
jgi:hypothetical protein